MRTEKEIYDLVLNFAFQDERIRIVTLEGSRTNVNIPKDNLQDYDITFFVIDMGEFLKSDDWLSVFGNRIMMQKPEDMELFPPEEKGFSYIMKESLMTVVTNFGMLQHMYPRAYFVVKYYLQ